MPTVLSVTLAIGSHHLSQQVCQDIVIMFLQLTDSISHIIATKIRSNLVKAMAEEAMLWKSANVGVPSVTSARSW